MRKKKLIFAFSIISLFALVYCFNIEASKADFGYQPNKIKCKDSQGNFVGYGNNCVNTSFGTCALNPCAIIIK